MSNARLLAICAIFLAAAARSYASPAPPVHVLPEPVRITQRSGWFQWTGATKAVVLSEDKAVLRVVKQFAAPASAKDSSGRVVIVSIGPVEGGTEGYVLDVSPTKIRIRAGAAAGVFYAFQTLLQLRSGQHVPAMEIVDYPRFGWRGMHLDVSRHFFGAAYIKRYLDLLAMYKINVFHWHLTDSHGWRLEIKQYPRLTSVGGWRADREGIPMTLAEPTAPGEAATYGGFYTQEEVRAIVAYAAERFITVVPEIEMPGHCTAALVAYPQFSDLNNATPLLMPCGYAGDLQHNFCAGYDSTFLFLEGILRETMALFPSPFIHIGGDEVREGPWLTCPRCQRRMKEKGFTTVRALQAWMTSRVDSFITASGRKMIGWDEVRNGALAPGSVIMSWHGDASGKDSSGRDHDVVMAPYRYTYFDFYQSDPRLEPDITYAPLFLDSVYAFDPKGGGRILGGEACLWTENVPTPARVEYMLMPRLLALSEGLWTPAANKDYPRFVRKVKQEFSRLDRRGTRYATSMFNPGIHPVYDSGRNEVVVRLSTQTPMDAIRYTLDGTEPTATAALYKEPVRVGKSSVIRAAVFVDGRRAGKVNTDTLVLHAGLGAPAGVVPAPDEEGTKGMKRLTDGILGTVEPYDGRWVSFHDSVVTVQIDLGHEQDIHSLALRCMEDQIGYTYLPREIRAAYSADGLRFDAIADWRTAKVPAELPRHVVLYEQRGLMVRARYIRVRLTNAMLWKEEMKNLLFVDEIIVK